MSSSPAKSSRAKVLPEQMAPGPLFVVSMWRSGSSLLYALLNKHPQVGLMYEADLMLLGTVFRKPRPLRDWANRWEFWNQALSRHGLDVAEFADNRDDFPGAFAAAHQAFARKKGASIWGDKSPNYYDRLQEMAEIFPAARFIIVWRDPLGTANSILRAAQSGNSYFQRKGSTLRGLLGNEVFRQQCQWLCAHDKPVLEVNYEDLVADPAQIMQQVCRFLDLDYSDGLSSLEGADRSAIYDGKHHSLVKGTEIVSRPRANVVGEALRGKINRYAKLWRQQSGASWPAFHHFESSATPATGAWEHTTDKLAYQALRAYDTFTASCFSVAPLALLQRYRKRKYRKPAGSADGIPQSVAPAKEA